MVSNSLVLESCKVRVLRPELRSLTNFGSFRTFKENISQNLKRLSFHSQRRLSLRVLCSFWLNRRWYNIMNQLLTVRAQRSAVCGRQLLLPPGQQATRSLVDESRDSRRSHIYPIILTVETTYFSVSCLPLENVMIFFSWPVCML